MAKLPATSLRDLCHATELAEAAYSLRHVDAAASQRYARLAVKRAELLPAGRVEADARAFAWAHLGNALRIGNDLLESESALLTASQYLDDGSGDGALRAEILSFRASTLEACRRFEDAATALHECLAIRRALGDRRGTAGCLVQLANVHGDAGNPAEAVRLLREALPLIAGDPRLAYVALHNLCVFLVMSGHAATAQEIVLEQEVGGLVCAEPLLLVRRRWLLAEIAGALGDHEIAAAELAEVRDVFLARDQDYDAALAGLELAIELGAQGHTAAVESVLSGVAALFSLLGIRREATAARLLEDAARNSTLALEAVPRVISALRREPMRTPRGGRSLAGRQPEVSFSEARNQDRLPPDGNFNRKGGSGLSRNEDSGILLVSRKVRKRSPRLSKILPPLARALRVLRDAVGWSSTELAAALGFSSSLISDYEGGRKTLSRERLETIVATMGLHREAIDDALTFLDKVTAKSQIYPLEPGAAAGELRRIETVVQAAAGATAEVVRPLVLHLSVELRAVVDRQEAKVTWQRLIRKQPAERRKLIRKSNEYRSWALCELACAESVKVAPDSADRAVEYAELAVEISRLTPGEDLFRRRLQGYAEAHLGNARRVHGSLREADAIFSRARSLWQAGAPGDPGLLNEAKFLSLEASLRIDQLRPAEALKLIDQALAVDRGEERKTLLINRGGALEQLGDYDSAIAALRQATPLIDGDHEPRLLWAVRFNLLSSLCHLRRFDEAQALLPEVRAQAERLGQELDLVRTLWLEGWVDAGLGRKTEAVGALEQVSWELIRLQIPSDAALASLELAVLYLEDERTAEVRALGEALVKIFAAQVVHPGALAALRLFYEAAKKERATVELAQQLLDYLFRAQHDPELRFEVP